jgi:hypothetical protein
VLPHAVARKTTAPTPTAAALAADLPIPLIVVAM